MEVTKEMLKDYLKNYVYEEELVNLWNGLQLEKPIFMVDDLQEILQDTFEGNCYKSAMAVYNGKLSLNDEFFIFNEYGNIISSNYFEYLGDFDKLTELVFPIYHIYFNKEDIKDFWRSKNYWEV